MSKGKNSINETSDLLIADYLKKTPYGYCQCGCGKKTNLAKQTDRKQGYVKGKPYKFLAGHWGKLTRLRGADSPSYTGGMGSQWEQASNWKGGKFQHQSGYVYVFVPDHLHANPSGYVHEAILIIEAALGKLLKKGAVAHHQNKIKNDNRPQNLVACNDNAYHTLLHRRLRAYLACGHASWRRCHFCQEYSDPEDSLADMYINGSHSHHRACKREWNREWKSKNRERVNENQRKRRQKARN